MSTILLMISLCLSLPLMGQTMKPLTNAEKVQKAFNDLNKDNLEVVDEFYSEDLQFIDPVGKINGRADMKSYYKEMYKNVKSVKFDFSDFYQDKNTVVGVWKMTLITDSLKGGEPIVVDGNSVIVFNEQGQAKYHRDYFDMGEFIYEHIPVLGFAVRKVKERLKHK